VRDPLLEFPGTANSDGAKVLAFLSILLTKTAVAILLELLFVFDALPNSAFNRSSARRRKRRLWRQIWRSRRMMRTFSAKIAVMGPNLTVTKKTYP